MGEVYQARDTRLGREVAVKVLPEAFASDPERLARFDREARALAALNHPNIAQVYGSGTSGSTSYIVMELVPGEELSSVLARGPLPVPRALAVARQIVEALEAAHAAGLVHRDLKPANIKVTPEGTVKVLDFGLAKPVQDSRAPEGQELDDSPTITSPAATMRGVILGTAAYMSPEQARGEAVDRRSDIWAFGAVLYEMLSGHRAFAGDNLTDVLSAVIRTDPDWQALPTDVPASVRALLQGCLQKERAKRIPDISTARFAIDVASSLVTATQAARPRRRWPGIAAAVAALVLIGAAALPILLRTDVGRVARYTVTPGEGQEVVDASGVDIALSPDGAWMVYVARSPNGGTHLLRRSLDELDAIPVPGSQGARAPVVSPDGRSIAFVADGGIRTIQVAGGPAFTVVTSGASPAWGDDGMIYFGRGTTTYRVSAQGGEPVAVTTPAPNILQQWQEALPGGRGVLLTLFQGTPAQARVAVVGPEGGVAREILRGTMARYVPTGHVVYSTPSGTLLAAPFDVEQLAIAGPAVPLVEGVAVDSTGVAEFAVSRSGALLYATGIGSVSELVWVTRAGAVEPVDSGWTGEFTSPALSPDGTRLAVAIQGPESKDVWVTDLNRQSKLRLTLDGGRNDYPAWTPDGRAVTFASDRAGPSFDLWTKRSDGSGEPVLEIDEAWAIAEGVWSPDGRWFVHRTSTNVQGAGDILARRKGVDETPIPIVASRFNDLTPAISPNGRWLAYASYESGRSEIVVVPFPNAGDSRWPVSVGGGSEPVWSRDGRELFFRSARRELVAVRVQTDSTFSAGATTVLFPDRDYVRLTARPQYDVSRDGQRFVMIRPIGAGRPQRVILVRNQLSAR